MEIEGDALEKARRAMGHRSQASAARAMGVSARLFGDFERKGVPSEYVKAALQAFWPDERSAVPPLDAYEDIDLLTEIGRRFTKYKRERDEALSLLGAYEESSGSHTRKDERAEIGDETSPGEVPSADGLGGAGMRTGVRPPRDRDPDGTNDAPE